MNNVESEIIEIAKEIRKKDYLLYTWESALIEAKRILENRKKMNAVNSYYAKHY